MISLPSHECSDVWHGLCSPWLALHPFISMKQLPEAPATTNGIGSRGLSSNVPSSSSTQNGISIMSGVSDPTQISQAHQNPRGTRSSGRKETFRIFKTTSSWYLKPCQVVVGLFELLWQGTHCLQGTSVISRQHFCSGAVDAPVYWEGTGIYVGRSPLTGSGVRIRLPALRKTEHPICSQVMPHQEAPKVLELLCTQLATLTVVQLLPTPLPSGNHVSLIILTAGHLGCQQTISSPGSLPYFKPSSPLVLTITVTLDSPLCL